MSLHRPWGALALLSWLAFVTTMDATRITIALPSIAAGLGADAAALAWIVNAYTVALAGLLVLGGAVADRVGRRRMLHVGLAVFAAGSVLATLSASTGSLIAARWLMGIGAALFLPVGISTLRAIFPPDRRALATGILGAAGLLGAPGGVLVGGALLDRFAWPSVFAIDLLLIAPVALLAWRLVPETRVAAAHARPFDWPGAGLATLGTTASVWAILAIPRYGWQHPRVLLASTAAGLLLAAFVVWQRRAERALLDLRRIDRVAGGGCVMLAVCYFGLLGSLFALTGFLQNELRLDPFEAGVQVLPVVATTVVSFLFAGVLRDRLGLRRAVGGGLALVALGLTAMSAATPSEGFVIVLAALGLVGLGMGIVLPLVPLAIGEALPREQAALAGALADTSRYLGGAIGTAAFAAMPGGMAAPHLLAAALVAALVPAARVLPSSTPGRDHHVQLHR